MAQRYEHEHRRAWRHLWPVALVVFASVVAAGAARSAVPQQSAPAASASTDQDVIVVGERLHKGPPETLEIAPELARGRARHARRATEFAQCMRFSDLDLLHAAIDGPPQDSTTRFALGRLIQKNHGCYRDLSTVPPHDAAELGSCNAQTVKGMVDEFWNVVECRAPYDRAAILRRVIATYAGDLALTRQDTTDPAVQARFNAREVRRNRLRRDDDRLMFEIAVCMVRLRPEQAVKLTTSGDRGEQYRLEDTIITGAKACIGGASELGVDPSEFRNYISDAVYRWAVAARGVDSLIPEKG